MASKFDVGDVTRISVVFKNLAGTVVDPTVVKISIKLPTDVVLEYTYLIGAEVIKDSTGTYHMDYPITIDGMHYYKWTGTGAVYAAEESQFFVRITQF